MKQLTVWGRDEDNILTGEWGNVSWSEYLEELKKEVGGVIKHKGKTSCLLIEGRAHED